MAVLDQVWPDLGFHHDADLRPETAQEALHRERKIVGQITATDAVAEQLDAGLAAGRRGVSEQDAVRGMALTQRLDQGLRGAGLAD